jgi:hypothetical protein
MMMEEREGACRDGAVVFIWPFGMERQLHFHGCFVKMIQVCAGNCNRQIRA